MRKYYTDKERLEFVKEWKVSKLNQTAFAKKKGLAVATFRDWVHAYKNLQGQFIRIKPNNEIDGNLINEPELRMNMLSEEEKIKKSSHFSRFDHSIVVIEIGKVKLTSSIENAIEILRRCFNYD